MNAGRSSPARHLVVGLDGEVHDAGDIDPAEVNEPDLSARVFFSVICLLVVMVALVASNV